MRVLSEISSLEQATVVAESSITRSTSLNDTLYEVEIRAKVEHR